jgi:hypothetical protein
MNGMLRGSRVLLFNGDSRRWRWKVVAPTIFAYWDVLPPGSLIRVVFTVIQVFISKWYSMNMDY